MKSVHTFEVGQRVGTFYDENTDKFSIKPRYCGEYDCSGPEYGVVKSVASKTVRVLFDNEYLNENDIIYDSKTGKEKSRVAKAALVSPDVLLPEDELKARFSELEKEYDAVAKQVKEKLRVAAQSIREAQKLAKKELGTDLADMYDAYDPLYSAMDAAGWRTSSFGC